jgi:Sulfotransferase domain
MSDRPRLRVVGAGLPRTGTHSLKWALERLLGGPCYHMSVIPGHPYDLGPGWRTALSGGTPDWDEVMHGHVASVDWPASMFWEPLSAAHPDAIILLSERDSAATWYSSVAATVLPATRAALDPGWDQGRDVLMLAQRFAATEDWDSPDVLIAAYGRHNDHVRRTAPSDRLVEWRPGDGWEPICRALGLPVPDEPFPWTNRREDWA